MDLIESRVTQPIKTPKRNDGPMLRVARCVAIGLDQLHITARAGPGDFDEHAITIPLYTSTREISNVPLQDGIRSSVKPASTGLLHQNWGIKLSNSGDHRMNRCCLKGSDGDAIRPVLCAAGFNVKRLLRMVDRKGIRSIFLTQFFRRFWQQFRVQIQGGGLPCQDSWPRIAWNAT